MSKLCASLAAMPRSPYPLSTVHNQDASSSAQPFCACISVSLCSMERLDRHVHIFRIQLPMSLREVRCPHRLCLDHADLHTDPDQRLHLMLRVCPDVLVELHPGCRGEDGNDSGPAVLQECVSDLIPSDGQAPPARYGRFGHTWNQPNSSPFATRSPAFLDQPMDPTSIATNVRYEAGGAEIRAYHQ